VKARLELKCVTEIGYTSIIGSYEILILPHGPTDLFIGHLSKAEVHFLVLRCLNLYSFEMNNYFIFDQFCLVLLAAWCPKRALTPLSSLMG